jgi:hypothetical protein
MVHVKWQRMFVFGALVLAAVYPVGAALAASHSTPQQQPGFSSCFQRVKEDLGTVLPGASSENNPKQCDRLGSAGTGLIPVTGEVNGSVSWRDMGASGLLGSGGWHDAGAGSR